MNRNLIIVLSIFIILLLCIGSYLAINNNKQEDSKNNSSNITSGDNLNNTNVSKDILKDNNTSDKNNTINNKTSKDSKNSNDSNDSSNHITKHSTQQIEKISTKILDKYPEAFGSSKIVKVSTVRYDSESGLWLVSFVNRKTGKNVGRTYIVDETGKMPIM